MATLFLCGDVMTGRGVDQILPHRSNPRLFEPYADSATDYVALAERANGPIGAPKDFGYIWGDALAEIERRPCEARIANLETAVTTSDDAWPDKGIHYRMHPANLPCLAAARLDCCVLANNHVMDWGRAGLEQTLRTLRGAGLRTAGAGEDLAVACAPAVIPAAGGRVLVFGWAMASSGVPPEWAATVARPGVNFLDDLSEASVHRVAREAARHRREGDLVVVSIHWGGNWGYEIGREERDFARGLVDAGVDVVHGHSSHHPKGIEFHAGRPILYGCGDLLNDYEGIEGQRSFRPELCLLYFVEVEPATSRAARLELVPMRVRRMRLERAGAEGGEWLRRMIERESARFGTRVGALSGGSFSVHG